MSSQILDSLNSLLTPALLARASSQLGESEGGVAKALGAAFPTLLSGILDKSGDSGALRQIFDLISGPANDAGVLRDPGVLLGAQRPGTSNLGGQLLSVLFSGRTDRIVQSVAQYAGIRVSTASTLIGMAAPLVLSWLGQRVKRDGLGLQGLVSLLSGERDSIRRAVPGEVASVLRDRPQPVPGLREQRASTSPGWLWPALIGLAVLGGLWWLLGRGEPDAPLTATAPPPADAPPVAAAPPSARMVTRDLPGGTRLEIPEGGLESRLVAYLAEGRGADEDVWFEFDRIQFETGSASLRPESRAQLRDVASILKAYPAVKLKIGGYTDNTGDAAANRELSEARAESVRSELVAAGVAADRLDAEGYGQEHPVASNDTMEGRARNRRIALRVTED